MNSKIHCSLTNSPARRWWCCEAVCIALSWSDMLGIGSGATGSVRMTVIMRCIGYKSLFMANWFSHSRNFGRFIIVLIIYIERDLCFQFGPCILGFMAFLLFTFFCIKLSAACFDYSPASIFSVNCINKSLLVDRSNHATTTSIMQRCQRRPWHALLNRI